MRIQRLRIQTIFYWIFLSLFANEKLASSTLYFIVSKRNRIVRESHFCELCARNIYLLVSYNTFKVNWMGTIDCKVMQDKITKLFLAAKQYTIGRKLPFAVNFCSLFCDRIFDSFKLLQKLLSPIRRRFLFLFLLLSLRLRHGPCRLGARFDRFPFARWTVIQFRSFFVVVDNVVEFVENGSVDRLWSVLDGHPDLLLRRRRLIRSRRWWRWRARSWR